jgi:hypothetical protein
MSPDVLCDSDIIIKLCVYDLKIWNEGRLLGSRRLSALEASRYIIPKRISRARTSRSKRDVRSTWRSFETSNEFLEPEEPEVLLAADMETLAQRSGYAFDSGESLLVSLLVNRGGGVLLTGDKRAIIALCHLCGFHAEAAKATKKVACLEQLVANLVAQEGGIAVRAAICGEPTADAALSICFRCASSPADDAAYLEGLNSYVEDLRERSGDVICDGLLGSLTIASLANSAEEDGIGAR